MKQQDDEAINFDPSKCLTIFLNFFSIFDRSLTIKTPKKTVKSGKLLSKSFKSDQIKRRNARGRSRTFEK